MLLAVGWWLASLREQAGLAREHEASRRQTAERVAAAVREGLEELRRREDARPFYLYNHFYSPPEVLALGDAVAVSPLAADPDDPRILGHFQVDPGGRVRTPYPVDDDHPGSPRADQILAVATTPAFAPLRAQSFGEPAPDTRLAQADLRPRDQDAPLTTNIGQLSNRAYQDLAAQTNDPEPQQAPQQQQAARPRKQVPITSRNQVSWEAIQSQQMRNVPLAQANDAAPLFEQSAAQQLLDPIPAQQTSDNLSNRPGRKAQARAPTQARQQPQAPQQAAPSQPSAPLPASIAAGMPQGTEVDYTPMAYLSLGDALVLQRVVSHAETGSVQGVLLDRAYLVDTWLPAVAARHAPAGELPRVVVDADACADPQAVSEHLPGVWLCFAAPAAPPDHLAFQAGALLGLIVIVGVGVVVVARAARRADELSAQKTAFVSAVSHELRTPLTTLRMHAELLQEGLVAPGSLATIHDDLVRESVRLSRLVENVLAVSQLEEGRRVLDLRPGDLAALIREVALGQARHIASKGFTVELDLPDELRCRFDAQAIEQIVVNLLDNALKYAAESDDRRLRVALLAQPGRAVLHVQDRGPGIPVSDRERVFQRFVRVQRASTAHTPGTGLGLSLVRDLARAHGGDAHARARPGGGADIEVWLPRELS
ncbi:MAG: HAMP domain-containing histidine kinase [Nannocystis sp.]|uniref:sensor histidine kinase n=1 Tax=Nannocystis sp. TaxID=1962667 RepID=UPI002424E72B|nr:HAMP domain-containing sensor histidine kinase [Nannocystis sp.]MBK9755037.1 HAMP domain-containing histidine kinase [Nannocystis sp.]